MALRTINEAQTAYVHFTLSAGYFLDFMPQQGRSTTINLRLETLVSIFRSVNGVDMVWLQLAVDTECYLRVQLVCKNGVTKLFDLKIEEVRLHSSAAPAPHPPPAPTLAHSYSRPSPLLPHTQMTSMSAVYSKEYCSTRICAEAHQLQNCLAHLPNGPPAMLKRLRV